MNELFWMILATNPKVNSVGIVARPKTAITSIPEAIEPLASANVPKMYTNPQGINPLRTP